MSQASSTSQSGNVTFGSDSFPAWAVVAVAVVAVLGLWFITRK